MAPDSSAVDRARVALEAAQDAITAALRALGGPATEGAVPTADDIWRRRETLGLSRMALSRKCGLSQGMVSEIERGKRDNPRTLAHVGQVLARLEQGKE